MKYIIETSKTVKIISGDSGDTGAEGDEIVKMIFLRENKLDVETKVVLKSLSKSMN